VKISLILPTNRTSYSAVARALESASLDVDKFELIVRDNSENDRKRAFLNQIESPNMRLVTVANCGAYDNFVEALRLATGEFVYLLADDDWVSSRGLMQLHALAAESEGDPSVGCITGAYLLETSSATGFFQYSGLNSPEPLNRLTSYLDANTTNFLCYSAVRRSLATFSSAFVGSLPYKFSFHDQLISLLYLTLGRILQINRVVYFYDLGDWETPEGSLSKDRAFYSQAGLPLEYDRLHWLFCALEGAFLLKSQLVAEKARYNTAPLADLWFQTMFNKFKCHNRESGYGQTTANFDTLQFRRNLLSQQDVDLNGLLLDLCDLLEIADSAGGERYFNFWSTL